MRYSTVNMMVAILESHNNKSNFFSTSSTCNEPPQPLGVFEIQITPRMEFLYAGENHGQRDIGRYSRKYLSGPWVPDLPVLRQLWHRVSVASQPPVLLYQPFSVNEEEG